MIAKFWKYCQQCRERGDLLREGRALLQALGLPSAAAPDLEVVSILMRIGVGHLRAAKTNRDATRAAQTMDQMIHDPAFSRPSREKAGLN